MYLAVRQRSLLLAAVQVIRQDHDHCVPTPAGGLGHHQHDGERWELWDIDTVCEYLHFTLHNSIRFRSIGTLNVRQQKMRLTKKGIFFTVKNGLQHMRR